MPRYLIERVFPDGFPIAPTEQGRDTCHRIAARNAELGVTWLHSYIAEDGRRSFCICEASSPEAVRRAAGRSNWPVDAITQVEVVHPHVHLGPPRKPARTPGGTSECDRVGIGDVFNCLGIEE